MPPLDVQQEPLSSPVASPLARPVHPSPAISLLRLEALTPKEVGWWGHRFGIDTAYLMTPSGWGEMFPVYGIDALEFSDEEVIVGPE